MRRGWRVAVATAFVLVGAAATFVIAGAALSDSGPGWEPEAGVLGTITFYDANGTQVTGGDLSQHPSAFYAAASAAGRSGDSLAQLKLFTPQVGVLPALWTGDTLTGATSYPNTKAPAPVAHLSLPVATGTPGDFSIADYISEFPNNLTQPGYQDLYELRLYTSGPGVSQNLAYFRVDIQVTTLGIDQSGEVTGLWNVVYPISATSSGAPSVPPTPSNTPSNTPTQTLSPSPTDTGSAPVSGVTTTITATTTVTATTTTTATATPTPTATPVPTGTAATQPAAVQTTGIDPTATANPTTIAVAVGGGAAPPPTLHVVGPVGGPLSLAAVSTSLATLFGLGVAGAAVTIVAFIYFYNRRNSGFPNG